jgi:hypothetical protein
MKLFDVYHSLVNLGEAADRLAPLMLQRQHRAGMALGDLAVEVSEAIKSLSPATLDVIKQKS